MAFCDAKMAEAVREVARFKAHFDASPFDALVWSQSTFDAVAVVHVVGRVRSEVEAGKPLPLALREQRVWGVKEKLFERLVPRLDRHTLARLVAAAATCDGIVKGLKHPQWRLSVQTHKTLGIR